MKPTYRLPPEMCVVCGLPTYRHVELGPCHPTCELLVRWGDDPDRLMRCSLDDCNGVTFYLDQNTQKPICPKCKRQGRRPGKEIA